MTDPEGTGDPQPQGERDDRPELDIDSAFAMIVAGFSEPVPHGVGPWPASEDLDDDPDGLNRDAGASDGNRPDAAATRDVGPAALTPVDDWDPPVRRISITGEGGSRPEQGGDSRAERPDDQDDEEGYQPPDPPPFPRGDLVSRVAWGAVVGGPVFLLLAALLWRSLPTFLLLLALAAFVGGFVTLVARMPQEHPDDPDDGAVV